jgi:hypothetical protein
MLPKFGRSLSASRWARSFSTTKTSTASPLAVASMAKNKEAPGLPVGGGSHYNMSGGEILHGRYAVVGKLGQGQYSTVWLAEDSQCVYTLCYFGIVNHAGKVWAVCSRESSDY